MDGLLRARPDADRPRTRDDEQRVCRNLGEVLRALPVYRGSGQLQRRLRHGVVGRTRRILLRRAAPSGRNPRAHADSFHRRTDSAFRRPCARGSGVRPSAWIARTAGMVSRASAESGEAGVALDRTWHGQYHVAVDVAWTPDESAAAPC